MSLLATRPNLQSISSAVSGNNLIDCIANANYNLSYWDNIYVGSKDRQTNLGDYGQPIISLSESSLNWAYDSTAIKTFTVTCNHSVWKFTSSSVATGFSVSVYDSTNTTYLGDMSGSYPSGSVVRVAPNDVNSGSSDKVCTLYCGTYNDYNVTGGEFTGTQVWNAPPPLVDIDCNDGTMTLSGKDRYAEIGSNQIWIQFIPDNLDPEPTGKTGDTIYVDIVKYGPVWVGSTTLTHCFNQTTKSVWITLNEYAQAGSHYYAILSTSNV